MSPVPATVRDQGPDGAGSVLLDDGTVVAFPADAPARGGFRLLRSGQRVALHLDADGRAVALTLPGERPAPS
jgi:hypothetical protein